MNQLVANGLTSRYGKGTDSDATDTMVAAPLSHGSNPNSNMAGRRREDDYNLVAGPLGGCNDGIGRRSEDDSNLVAVNLTPRGRREDGGWGGFAGADLSATETDVAATLDRAAGNTRLVGASVRRLTPRECERLQALPDDWTLVPDSAPDSRRYAALGDAVTASVAEWIGTRLRVAVQGVKPHAA